HHKVPGRGVSSRLTHLTVTASRKAQLCFSVLDCLGSLQSHTYSFVNVENFIGDEFQLPFHGLAILVVNTAPFAQLLEMFQFPIWFAAGEVETVEKPLGLFLRPARVEN